jgi:hypothetical protein
VVKLLKTKANSLAITKPLLLANIKNKRTSISLSRCLNLSAISLSGLSSVPCLFLIINTLELCPIPAC